jgi:membrane protease YdiL (CAAX protease family)
MTSNKKKEFLISIVFISAQYLAACIAILILKKSLPQEYEFIEYLAFYLTVFAIPIFIFIRFYLKEKPLLWLRLHLSKIHVGIIVSAFIFVIFLLSHKFQFAPQEYNKGFLLALSGACLAGLFEEIAFRGFYLKVFIQKLGFTKANILVSIMFAALHFAKIPSSGFIEIPILFVFSLFMGYLYNQTHSLLNTILVHAVYNSVMLLF